MLITGGSARRLRPDWVALCYLGLFLAGQGVYLGLGPSGRGSFLGVASTNVANLTHDPVGCLVLSAFVTGGDVGGTLTWLPLIAVGLVGAVRAVGAWRTVAVAVAGHVVGTLVSEGVLARRVWTGALPDSHLHMTDVGPSYVVVSALTLALLCLPWSKKDRRAWAWRTGAAAAMLALIFPGQIFAGLTSLDVAALGHVTSITVAGLVSAAWWSRRRSPRAGRAGVWSGGHASYGEADQVGEAGGGGAEQELA